MCWPTAGPNLLRNGALRNQFELQLPRQIPLLNLGVLPDERSDQTLDLVVANQQAHAKARNTFF